MKKGFTLIELLAVIVILAIIALIATPIILGVVENARKSAAGSSALGYLDAVEKAIALDSLDNIVYPTGEIEILSSEYYQDIEVQGEKPSKGRLTVTDRYLITSAVLCVNNYKVELTGHKIKKITKNACDEIKQRKFVEFGKDTSGAATPNLKGDLLPVAYDGENWIESDGTQRHWYNYDQKMWANAVILSEDGEIEEDGTIKEDDIDAFFVWIPKYRYKLWKVNEEDETSLHEIPIEFNLNNTVDSNNECQTPMESRTTGTCAKDKWMTHPAFISFDVDGFWVGKFETTGSENAITVKPNSGPLIGHQAVKSMFDAIYNYDKSEGRILDSHMMKNTEWGAVAYLTYSKYGINDEIGINNYQYGEDIELGSTFMTGCGAAPGSETRVEICNSYNTTEGMQASTTGNITGVYDMSGGVWEYLAGYQSQASLENSGFDRTSISQYDSKYFDVYNADVEKINVDNAFAFRILGDATDEIAEVYRGDGSGAYHGWHDNFIQGPFDKSTTWVARAGNMSSRMFGMLWYTPITLATRLVLAPK